MRKTISAVVAAATLAGALAVTAVPASAKGWHHHGHGGAAVAAGILGLAAGAIIAGTAAPAYAAGPDPDYVAYCARKYRSFDPYTGTYLAYDGYRYPCR